MQNNHNIFGLLILRYFLRAYLQANSGEVDDYIASLSLSLYKCYFWLLIVKKTFFWHKHVYRNVRVALRHLAHLMLTLARSVDQLRSRDHVRFGRPISEGNLEK